MTGCLENTDLENADLRPQNSKTQTSKTQISKTQTLKTQTSKTQTSKTQTSKTKTLQTKTWKTQTCECLIIYKSSVYQKLCDIMTYNLSRRLEVYSRFSLATFKQYSNSKLSYGNFRFVNRGGSDSSLSLLYTLYINDVKNTINF